MGLINENFFLKLQQQQGNKIGAQGQENKTGNDLASKSASIFGAQGAQETQGAQGAAQKDKFSDASIFNMAGGGFGDFGASMGGDTLEIGNSTKNWANSMDVDNTKGNDKTKESKESDKTEKEDKTKEADNKDKKAEKSEKDKQKNAAIANGMFGEQKAEAAPEEGGGDGVDLGIEDEPETSASDKFGNTLNGKDNKDLLAAAKKVQQATGKSIVKDNDQIDMTELKNAVSGMKNEEVDEITDGKSKALKQAGAL